MFTVWYTTRNFVYFSFLLITHKYIYKQSVAIYGLFFPIYLFQRRASHRVLVRICIFSSDCFVNKNFNFLTKNARKWPKQLTAWFLYYKVVSITLEVSVAQHEGTREFKYSSLLLLCGPRCRAAINLMACFIKSFPWIFNLHSFSEGYPQQWLYFSFPVLFI